MDWEDATLAFSVSLYVKTFVPEVYQEVFWLWKDDSNMVGITFSQSNDDGTMKFGAKKTGWDI